MPRPDDFDFKVAANQRTIAFSLCPSTASKAARFPRDVWVALESVDHLALHYDNQVLLLLRRRPPGAKPTASFDCAKASTPTEKAICGSFDLASWDRSVALAFRQALDRQPPQKHADLRHEQKEWLQKRNQCGADLECIDDQQWRRVEELSHR